jgi:hypothetical protein
LSRVFLQGTIDIELEKLIENQTRLENIEKCTGTILKKN